MFAHCKNCGRGVVVYALETNAGLYRPEHLTGSSLFEAFAPILVWPEPAKTTVPEHLPPEVEGFLDEADHSFAHGKLRLAAAGYRSTLEQALKAIMAMPKKKDLKDRIEAMKAFAPDALIEAMHEIRFLGNDAVHDGTTSKEDIAAGRDFVRLFLVYAFELPAKVDAAKAKRATA